MNGLRTGRSAVLRKLRQRREQLCGVRFGEPTPRAPHITEAPAWRDAAVLRNCKIATFTFPGCTSTIGERENISREGQISQSQAPRTAISPLSARLP